MFDQRDNLQRLAFLSLRNFLWELVFCFEHDLYIVIGLFGWRDCDRIILLPKV